MVTLESPGQQVGQTLLGHGSGSVLQIEVYGRQLKRIGFSNPFPFTWILSRRYECEQSLFWYNIIVLIHRNLWPCYYLYYIFGPLIKMTPLDSPGLLIQWPHCFLMTFTGHATSLVLGDAQWVIPHLGLGHLICRVKWWHSLNGLQGSFQF